MVSFPFENWTDFKQYLIWSLFKNDKFLGRMGNTIVMDLPSSCMNSIYKLLAFEPEVPNLRIYPDGHIVYEIYDVNLSLCEWKGASEDYFKESADLYKAEQAIYKSKLGSKLF